MRRRSPPPLLIPPPHTHAHTCRCLTHPPEVGYSQQALLARGSVLRRAVELLLDTDGRRKYDDALHHGATQEDVPDEFVPGEAC